MGQVARHEGASLVLKQVKLLSRNLPVIVTGDFNAVPTDDPIKVLTDEKDPRHLTHARTLAPLCYGPEWTFHDYGRVPLDERVWIDYIFVKGNVKVLRHGVLAESLDNLSAKMDKFGQEAPKFRSEGLDNMSAIQKSMTFEKDDNGKIELNIINQRPMVAKMIEKALTNESDDSIRKSLEADALNYMTNPYAETIGEELARYMYTKNGIKFVK